VSSAFYFGGSFYPPHRAHTLLVKHLLDSFEKKVLVVPTYQNPLKVKEDFLSSNEHEELLCLWRDKVLQTLDGQSKLIWVDEEFKSKKTCYTIDTLTRLKESYLEIKEWNLVLGLDSVVKFEQWKNWEKLLEQVNKIYVFKRQGYSKPNLNPVLEVKFVELDCVLPELSSSEIRENKSCWRDSLDRDVFDFMTL